MSRMAARTPPVTAAGNPARPGYTPPAGTIDRLRGQRRARRIARTLYDGAWRKILLEAGRTQFLFRRLLAGDAAGRTEVKTIEVHMNLVALCVDMHAEVLMDSDAQAGVPEEFAAQREAIDRIRESCLADTRLLEAARTAGLEGQAPLVIGLSEFADATISVGSNEEWFDVGPCGPDGQPTVWERRWVVQRETNGNRRRWLRVERHRAGLVEQEAYRTDSDDVLRDLGELERVALAEALGIRNTGGTPVPLGTPVPPGTPVPLVPLERVETGVPYPLVVRLVRMEHGGRPRMLFDEETLGLLDATAAVLTQVCRAHGVHYTPRMRAPGHVIDKKTGEFNATLEVLVDPNKEIEYIVAGDLRLEEGLRNAERLMRMCLAQARMAPSLIGINPGEGAQTMSAENRRIQATTTLAAASGAQQHAEPAIGRAFTVACLLDTRQMLRGYDVAPVTVALNPDIPKDAMDRIERQERLLIAGLTSRRRAVAAIHGEEQADAVMDEIESDESARAERQRAASFAAVGVADGGDDGGGA